MVRTKSGSALVATAVMMGLLLFHYCELSEAANYTVGGPLGWTFDVVRWPKGKHFKAGDFLVFQYIPLFHNVVVVNKAGYDDCTTPEGAKVYQTGNDHIKLVKGQNYFICSYIGHCQLGMKIAVTAT